MTNQIVASAFEDLSSGLKQKKVWMALASEDIGDQHRRTTLGPLWLLFNYLAFAGVFIFVFKMNVDTPKYPTYAAVGLFVWFYIADVITNSITLFVREENFIKGTRLPMTVYVLRQTMQSMIRAGYASIGCVAIILIDGPILTPNLLWSAAGLGLILLVTPPTIMVFAFIGAYFPDSQFIVKNMMRLGLFITPVFWALDGQNGIRTILYYWNPFTYFLEIFRGPLVTDSVPLFAFFFCTSVAILVWFLAVILLGKFKDQVVFYL